MEEKMREKAVPEYKIKLVEEIIDKIGSNRTVLIASTKGLPNAQFQEIKKKLRGIAEVRVYKKSIVIRALGKIEKGAVRSLKDKIGADIALFFSKLDPFELSSVLSENQSPKKAKAGDIAPEDINIEPGPTELLPGPAISELSGVGLKVAVENGKLSIKQGRTIVKAGEVIDEKVSGVMAKLDILPMKVGFLPLVAYDKENDMTFEDIKIDKEGALEALREAISKAIGLAISVEYVCKETVTYFISKAGIEEKALIAKIGEEIKEDNNEEVLKEEDKTEMNKEKPKEDEKIVEEEKSKENEGKDDKSEKPSNIENDKENMEEGK